MAFDELREFTQCKDDHPRENCSEPPGPSANAKTKSLSARRPALPRKFGSRCLLHSLLQLLPLLFVFRLQLLCLFLVSLLRLLLSCFIGVLFFQLLVFLLLRLLELLSFLFLLCGLLFLPLLEFSV